MSDLSDTKIQKIKHLYSNGGWGVKDIAQVLDLPSHLVFLEVAQYASVPDDLQVIDNVKNKPIDYYNQR
jgi:hypothetical protein